MSFGGSVGDIVLISEKAITIYKRCKGAGKDYQSLAKSADVLHGNLRNVDLFLEKEKDSLDGSDRLQSLLTACGACNAVLDEVGKFLDKYTSLRENSSIRFFQRMQFVLRDIDGLRARMASSSQLVEQSLAPLTHLSLLDLREALGDLVAEYREGKHERSVLSVALVGNQKIDKTEAMEQVEKDLMDKEVHPDAIDVHQAEIWRWICESIPEDETMDTEPESDRGHYLAGERQVTSSPGDSELGFLGDSVSRLKIQDRPNAQEDPKRQLNALNKEMLTQPDNNSEDELYESSVIARPRQTGTLFLKPDNRSQLDFLPPPSEAPSSRRSSMGSHASKDSKWRPSNSQNSDFVMKMLTKPLRVSPFQGAGDPETASFCFKRAFRQQDYTDRGYLTRDEVVQMISEALVRTDAAMSRPALNEWIHAGDQNRDGKVDSEEFVVIMHNLLHETVDLVDTRLKARIQADISQANDEAQERYAGHRTATAIPWGLSRHHRSPFYDAIEQTVVEVPPPPLPLSSFTLMAEEVASRAVKVINEADKYWQAALPTPDKRKTFSDLFEKVRSVAVKFTRFYNDSDKELSDLDEMMCALRVHQFNTNDASLGNMLDDLRGVATICENVAAPLRGFVWRLEHPNIQDAHARATASWPSTKTLIKDLEMWRAAHMDACADQIFKNYELNWKDVDATVARCRTWYRKQRAASSQMSPSMSQRSSDFSMSRQSISAMGSPSSARHSSGFAQENMFNALAMDMARDYAQDVRRRNDAARDTLRHNRRHFELNTIRFTLAPRKKAMMVRAPKPPAYVLNILNAANNANLSGPHRLSDTRPGPIVINLHHDVESLLFVLKNTTSQRERQREVSLLGGKQQGQKFSGNECISNREVGGYEEDTLTASWTVDMPRDIDHVSVGPYPWLELVTTAQ